MTTINAGWVRQRVEACAGAGLGVAEYSQAVLDQVRQAVPFDSACLATTDPATGLMTGTRKFDLSNASDREFARFEYEIDDVNLFRDLAVRRDPVGILALDTGGHPETSPRWRDFIVPMLGVTQELRAVFRVESEVWGLMGVYRLGEGSGFSPAEAAFLSGLSDTVGRGLRAAVVTSAASAAAGGHDGPAVLIVGPDGELTSATPAALELLPQLGSPGDEALPASLYILVSAARAFRQGRLDSAPRARVRLASGEWLVLNGAPLSSADGRGGDVVVTMESAGPPDVVPLVVAAHGLSEREQDVVRLVLAGATTNEIGRRLHLSPYTVQDHLKVIFDKVGVRSRRELTAQVFFDQYAPRLGDPLGPSGWFAN